MEIQEHFQELKRTVLLEVTLEYKFIEKTLYCSGEFLYINITPVTLILNLIDKNHIIVYIHISLLQIDPIRKNNDDEAICRNLFGPCMYSTLRSCGTYQWDEIGY